MQRPSRVQNSECPSANLTRTFPIGSPQSRRSEGTSIISAETGSSAAAIRNGDAQRVRQTMLSFITIELVHISVKVMATPLAGASVDRGVEVEFRKSTENRRASGGGPAAPCSALVVCGPSFESSGHLVICRGLQPSYLRCSVYVFGERLNDPCCYVS